MLPLTVTLLALSANSLTVAEFTALHRDLQPEKEAPWRSIPWETSLIAAQAKAAEEGKPLFIWAMDGHPLGCT